MPATRIYVVRTKDCGSPARLVEATHPSNALRHVAEASFSVAIATQADLVALLPTVKVEKISAEQQELPT